MTAIDTHPATRPGYRFVVSSESRTARDMAEWSDSARGRVITTSARSCAARKLARLLVENAEPDGPVEAVGPAGDVRYTVGSLYAFAKGTIVENPRLGVRAYTTVSRGTFSRPGRGEG
jgi:hypothetical protein